MTRVLAALLVSLAMVPAVRAAARPWRLIRGTNVIVVGQRSPRALRTIAVELEQFRIAVGGLVRGARQPLSVPTTVYTFDDRKSLEPFVPLRDGRPATLGGYCICGPATDVNVIAVSLAGYDDASRIVFHEYAHLLLRNAAPNVPLWLNEGLAEYYSTFRLRNEGRQAEIGRPIEQHVAVLRQRFVPVAQLIAVDRSSRFYNEGDRRSIFYAEAWALTHYLLMERPNGGAALDRYLSIVAGGAAPDHAFADAFGTATTDMDSELQQYARRPALRSVTYALAERVDVDEPEQARTIAAAEAEARLGDLQLRVGRMEEAAVRIQAASAAAPDSAPAQLALAFLRLRQNRESEAWPALERAATLARDDFIAQYTYALAMLRSDADAPDESPRRRELAHAALTRALAVNPTSADALAWQAYTDLSLDTRLDEARAAIARAIELAPGRLDYRLRLAEICLRTGEQAEARRLLTDLATVKDDEALARHARALLQRLP
jgi:tetratricopeptide (TPR) repeat protein